MEKNQTSLATQKNCLFAIKEHLKEIRQELEFLREFSNEMIDIYQITELIQAENEKPIKGRKVV